MKAEKWKEIITEACQSAGTYKPFFENVIDTLADILEKRDLAKKGFEKSGGNPVIIHTNQGGNANPSKNPFLVVIDDYNKTALAYWRDLGLTPKGLKAINDQALKGKEKSGLEEVLAKIGG